MARKGDGSKPAMSKEDMMKKKGSGKAKFFATTSKGFAKSKMKSMLVRNKENLGKALKFICDAYRADKLSALGTVET